MNLQELKSFKLSDAVGMHSALNPKLWHDNQLDLKVRVQLLKIARDFIDYLGIDEIHLKDVRILGSNVAYSYTPHSDLDLHLFVDMNKLNPDEVYQELFASKKMLYNDGRKITIHGIPVECYVQDINTPAVSLGEFSVLKNKWIRHPVKRKLTLDHSEAKMKYEKMSHLVGIALKSPRYRVISRVLEKLNQYRRAGLQRSGEYSAENVAYKAIRQTGAIEALYKRRDRLIGKSLSIESMYMEEDSTDQAAQYAPPTKQIKQHNKWGMYTERSSQVGDGYIRWIEDNSTCYIIDIQAPRQTRGRDILLWLKKATGKELYAVGVVDDAEEFWDKMEEEGIITGFNNENFMEFFNLMESKILNKPTMTVQQIAKKHGVSVDSVKRQLEMGIKTELEHTKSKETAREIALDHLGEFPDYYTKLSKAKF